MLFDDEDDGDERKGDEEEVKPLPKVSRGKALTVAESTKTSKPLVRSPNNKEDDDPTFSDYSKQSEMAPFLDQMMMMVLAVRK